MSNTTEAFIDPKADLGVINELGFLNQGRNAYGEWMKKLSPTDMPPRGKCAAFFKKHRSAHLVYHRSSDMYLKI